MCKSFRPRFLRWDCAMVALLVFAAQGHTVSGEPPGESKGAPSLLPSVPTGDMRVLRGIEKASPAKAQIDAAMTAPLVGTHETLPTGYRRTTRVEHIPLATNAREGLERAGKAAQIDPATGKRILQLMTDQLPENWGAHSSASGPVDSLGRPIVNSAPGLPGWAQVDIDALRAAIAQSLAERTQSLAQGHDLSEADGILGNFIGQAIVRGIAVDDLLDLDDANVVDSSVARSVIGCLHFYENLKYLHSQDGSYSYQQSVYPPAIVAFMAAHGYPLNEVLVIEDVPDPHGGQPSGCYARTVFARGMINLSGQTNLWVANGFDDESADISTGFPLFFFYDCQDPDNNDVVRVSSNGYLSFFQHGGGALDGINFTNDPIPDIGNTPNGYVAPWWDDLIVATNQGSTDRVSYKTEGAVDSRVFTVEWISISRLDGSTADFHYFQVKLFETTDVIELHIGLDVSAWQTDNLDSATTGIENYSGAGGDCGPNCLNTNNPPPPNDYRFTPFPRPQNDNCSNAIELINGASVTGNLHRATSDGNANCGDSSNNRDLWYTFVARCNGTLHADTCGSRDIDGPGTGIDSVLSVHSGCPGSIANQLACNDDAGTAGCNGTDSAVAVPMVAGQRVFIRVTHFGDIFFRFQSGAFRLNLKFVSTAPPANDNCAAAINILNGNTLVGNLLCASNDGSADCGSSATNPDIWYKFTAGASAGRVYLSLCGTRNNAGVDTGPDTSMSVHAGCPGTIANEIACVDDGFIPGCNTLDSRVGAALAPNQTVLIRVTHFGDDAFRVGNGVTVLHADFCSGLPNDANCDGVVNGKDVAAFTLAIVNPAAYSAQFPGCGGCRLDANFDGVVDVQDVGPFAAALVGS